MMDPRHSMYAIYAYIGVVLGVNVGIYGSPMECLGIVHPGAVIFVCFFRVPGTRSEPHGHTFGT